MKRTASEQALVIATKMHRAALESKFAADGYDVPNLQRPGKYSPFDPSETLHLFMDQGRPEGFLFNAALNDNGSKEVAKS